MAFDLVAQVPVSIDGGIVVTIEEMTVNYTLPQTVHKGALGVIGVATGVQDVSADFTMSVPKTGPEVNLVTKSAQPGGFTLTYPLGVKRFALTGCRVKSDTVRIVQGSGQVTISGSIIAEDRLQTG